MYLYILNKKGHIMQEPRKLIPGQLIGYARVSSYGQSLDIQTEKLEAYGCIKIYKEKISGINQDRPMLINCLDYVREQDVLVVTRLDRMARSVFHLGKIVDTLEKKKVNFVVIDQHIDTTTPQGKLMFNMLASFAEFENGLRKERQIEGIKKAQQKGVKFGRPTKVNEEIKRAVVADIGASNMSVRKIIKKHGISKDAYYKIKRAND